MSFDFKSYSELVFICRRNIKDSTIDNNVEQEPKAEKLIVVQKTILILQME